jgi:branched-subunit amino acid aminotransferase/4-amino-4-deoxychorismate lyase
VTWVWLDGRFLPERKALIPATDPGFLYGHGVFEVTRAYGGVPFRLADHLARMKSSARLFGIPFLVPDLGPVVGELCRRNRCPDAYVRITLSALGHLLVIARARRSLPRAWTARGAEVMIAPWRRDPGSPLAGHKTLNYLENVRTHEEALRRGCADALYVGLKGEILEGCVTNVFLVVEGRLVTPRLGRGILPGVTRKVVTEIARVRERRVRLKELWKADEAFLTNALVEILPITKPGPVTKAVLQVYREVVERETRASSGGRR